MKTKISLFLLIILVLVIVPACWDTQDISKNVFITAIGIDTVAGVTPKSQPTEIPLRYKVTVEIVKPSLLKESSRRANIEKPANIILTSQGATIENALGLLQSRLPHPVTLAHLNVILVGEKIAQKNFKNICTYFEKHPEVARRSRLMFVKNGEALDILKTKPLLNRYVAEELVAMTEVARHYSLGKLIPFTEFLKELRTNNAQALASRVVASENDIIIRHGSAVFDDWKLVGWLDANETKKANWFRELKKMVVIGKFEKGIYTYQVDKKSVSITPIIKDNQELKFKVKLKTDGIILQEEKKELDLTNPQNIKKLEKMFTQVITNEVKEAILKAQKDFKVDYLNLGMQLKNGHPEVYKKLNWKETFPKVLVDVEAEVKITRFGLVR